MRNLLTMTCMVILASCVAAICTGQTISLKGRVLDENGVPIENATVYVKQKKAGGGATITLADGSFTLRVNEGVLLMVTSVGYNDQQLPAVQGMTVKMHADLRNLSDVVVTGVGVATSKKKVPIDVATVSSKDFAKSATTSIDQALDGQIAGAQVQQTSGQPGAGFNIVLRGVNTLSTSAAALYIVDGTVVQDISNLDPSVVDHVEVVKGPAGGMLYGAKGGQGVIQIFTKKGAAGRKMTINLSTKVSIDNILKGKRPILAAYHHYVTDGSGNILNAAGTIISHDATGTWTDPAVPDPTAFPATVNNKTFNIPTYDHFKQAFRQALTYNHTINVAGGGNSSDYAFSASNLDQQDVFSNKFERTNLTLNLGLNPFKGFTFRSISQGIIGYQNLLNGNRFAIVNAYPWIDLNWRDSTGHRAIKTSTASNQNNSLSEQEWHQQYTKSLDIVQNFQANFKLPRYLELDAKYGIDYRSSDATNYYLNQTSDLQTALHWGPSRQGSLTNTTTTTTWQDALFTVFLRTDFQNDFHLSLPIRTTSQFSYEWFNSYERQYYAEGIQLPAYPPININVAAQKTDGDFYTAFTQFGFLFNQTIDYGNLFGISGGLRSDYASTFGRGGNAQTFDRGTVYFRPSEWMKGQHLVNDWKLRAAYGKAGTQPQSTGNYDRQTTLGVTTLGTGVALSTQTVARNPDLVVQLTSETEIGTDITFNGLKGDWLPRVTFSGTWWHRLNEDLEQTANVAPSTGFSGLLSNLSTIESHGLDMSLDVQVLSSGKFSWTSAVRWGFSHAVVTKISGGQDIINGEFSVKQGKALGLFYGQTPVHSLTQLMADGKTPYVPTASASNYELDNGTVINKTTYAALMTAANDQSVIGKSYPDFTSAWINTFTLFRDLTFSFQFDWVHGNNIYNLTRQWLYSPAGGSGGSGGVSKDFDQSVTINGKPGAYVNYYQSLYNLVNPSSWFVENGSYIRLRDLSLSYDFSPLMKVPWVKRLSATISGRNLLTFTKFHGMDPENTTAVNSQGVAIGGVGAINGVDYFGIPNLRSYQFGLNVGF
ncbi:SusC/RagA family TonB-linked outer membrane protein [Dinghuibacter silviterrae]|uniref:TonB-linked SusC/RagA family outer membrane protein n=1 Tax=Dinghuibacter silviterrae TaxID=1539049 RepID=A0A4R8DNX7_9BACT|nr:SusC/RagA family TonB-linked outer membrane protein [Dinghuibacter silviterrae]TDW99425.1 TonB-linked SusC/RagA family outer membrane protein [Dinghuibacter silviterrae]